MYSTPPHTKKKETILVQDEKETWIHRPCNFPVVTCHPNEWLDQKRQNNLLDQNTNENIETRYTQVIINLAGERDAKLEGNPFPVKSGLAQGSLIAPQQFNSVIDIPAQIFENKVKKYQNDNQKNEPIVNGSWYADDFTLCLKNIPLAEIKQPTAFFEDSLRMCQMKLNPTKTKHLNIIDHPSGTIKVLGSKVGKNSVVCA